MTSQISEIKRIMETAAKINLAKNNDRYFPGIITLEKANATVFFSEGSVFEDPSVSYIGKLGNYFAYITRSYNIGKVHEMHAFDAQKKLNKLNS